MGLINRLIWQYKTFPYVMRANIYGLCNNDSDEDDNDNEGENEVDLNEKDDSDNNGSNEEENEREGLGSLIPAVKRADVVCKRTPVTSFYFCLMIFLRFFIPCQLH